MASVLPPDEAQEFHRQLVKLLTHLPRAERTQVSAAIIALVQKLVATNAGHLAEALHTAQAAPLPPRGSIPPRGTLPPRGSIPPIAPLPPPRGSLRPSKAPRGRSIPPGPVISALPPPPQLSLQPSWHPIAEVATAEIVDVISALLRPPRNLRLCRISGCPNVATRASGATYRCDEHAEAGVVWKPLKMSSAEHDFAHMSSRARRLVDRLKSG